METLLYHPHTKALPSECTAFQLLEILPLVTVSGSISERGTSSLATVVRIRIVRLKVTRKYL